MGEAKRRNKLGEQGAQQLRQRITAGEFGQQRPAQGYLVVVDKSQRGRDALAMLRGFDGLHDMQALLASDALRMWEASSLFQFAVLVGGPGKAEQRCQLGATLDTLTRDVLPRAARSVQSAVGTTGAFVAVDDAVRPAVEHEIQRALSGAAASPSNAPHG